MKSLEIRFKMIQKNNPNSGLYITLANTVKSQKYSKQTIHRWFYKLVPREDYDVKDKKKLFTHLDWLTNLPEDDKKQVVNDRMSRQFIKERILSQYLKKQRKNDR